MMNRLYFIVVALLCSPLNAMQRHAMHRREQSRYSKKSPAAKKPHIAKKQYNTNSIIRSELQNYYENQAQETKAHNTALPKHQGGAQKPFTH
jgi:hypothetical protein